MWDGILCSDSFVNPFPSIMYYRYEREYIVEFPFAQSYTKKVYNGNRIDYMTIKRRSLFTVPIIIFI